MRAGARPRVQPGTFCSGPGQVSVSQDARAAEPHRRRLVKGKDLPAAKKAKLREKQLKAADPPPPPPSMPADATQATQIDDEHDHDEGDVLAAPTRGQCYVLFLHACPVDDGTSTVGSR